MPTATKFKFITPIKTAHLLRMAIRILPETGLTKSFKKTPDVTPSPLQHLHTTATTR